MAALRVVLSLACLLVGCTDGEEDGSGTDSADPTGTDDSSGGSASVTSGYPEACEFVSYEEISDPAWRLCQEYHAVLYCCIPPAVPGESDVGSCAASFEELHYSNGEAPEVCSTLMPVALECATMLGVQNCADMRAYFDGIIAGFTASTIGPPQDPTIPCYEEVVALWDAGCEPYLF